MDADPNEQKSEYEDGHGGFYERADGRKQ